jgi:hypothetical protein
VTLTVMLILLTYGVVTIVKLFTTPYTWDLVTYDKKASEDIINMGEYGYADALNIEDIYAEEPFNYLLDQRMGRLQIEGRRVKGYSSIDYDYGNCFDPEKQEKVSVTF